MAIVQFCTVEQCEKFMSQNMIALRTDDDPLSVTDAIDEASAYVAGILGGVYSPADLVGVGVIQYATRFYACCAICRRRGEGIPAGWEDMEARYDKLLMDYATGRLKLIETPQAPGGPAVSNQEYNLEDYPSNGVSAARSTDRRNPTDRRFSNSRTYRGPR